MLADDMMIEAIDDLITSVGNTTVICCLSSCGCMVSKLKQLQNQLSSYAHAQLCTVLNDTATLYPIICASATWSAP
jgi:hypothetical protein